KAQHAGWIAITAGWAFAVMAGVYTARAFRADGYINPVGPVVGLIHGKLTAAETGPMVAAEFLGAFVGAVLVWLHYLPHWREAADAGLKLAVFCTAPAVRRYPANVLS